MNCGKWQPAFVGAVMAAVTIASAIAIAQDAGPAEDALLLQTDTALLEGRLLPSDLEDPAFEQYVYNRAFVAKVVEDCSTLEEFVEVIGWEPKPIAPQ